MSTITRLNLAPAMFSEKETLLLEHGALCASTFRYPSGVPALRLKNELGCLVMLPFQGQQIWRAEFAGRDLTMKSMFTEPRPTRTYLENYGAFLIHCGMTAMGVPTGADAHPLHGELPNAPYREACLLLSEDDTGLFLGLSGVYQHTVAFSTNYLAEPLVKLYAGSSLFYMGMTVTNLKHTDMEIMYLAHVNFRPVMNSRLVYSARCTPETVRVRRSIPSHVHPKPGYREFLDELAEHPEKHHLLAPRLLFDPEVVFLIDYLTDQAGWAHTMQVHPDGSADYICHRPQQLDHGVRWICRTPDQDALGMALPATAEPEGYHAEQAKGNLKILPPQGQFACDMIAGALLPEDAHQVEGRIKSILAE